MNDGSTAQLAALSCWAVKRAVPESTDGSYWLKTPAMPTAQQVYCDQTTDGGGWALVGRGREGWSFSNDGQGDATSVAGVPTGQPAFVPAAYSATTVTQLLGGFAPASLADGLRIRRASNTAGSEWEEIRWPVSTMSSFSWQFEQAFALGDGASANGLELGSARTTADSRFTNGSRVVTTTIAANGGRRGFNNDQAVHGSSSATSFVWESGSAGYASPFAQVFIRPRLEVAGGLVRDGSTPARAAVSCWAIKQAVPTAPDGQYWLVAPGMNEIRRYFCDQTTQGGGWVLVGRGRQGWTFNESGQGSSDVVGATPSGTGAFVPATLSAKTINGLLGGAGANSLIDGVRIRRAADATGSSWQEIRWFMPDTRMWVWNFDQSVYGMRLAARSNIDGVAVAGSPAVTRDSTAGSSRVWTYADAVTSNQRGFAYQQSKRGSSANSSYLWESGSGYAVPFSQVFIRPRIVETAMALADGKTASRPAVSCLAAKMANPAAGDGAYFIQTALMSVPQQVWCDESTEGGGWMLVGRGRDGWSFSNAGQGSPAAVVTAPDGFGAFSPAALPAGLIDQLLGGVQVNQLADGVRLKRNLDSGDVESAEYRWPLPSVTGWRWDFDSSLTIGTGSQVRRAHYVGAADSTINSSFATTRDARYGNGDRIYTYANSLMNNIRGFNGPASFSNNGYPRGTIYDVGSGYGSAMTQVHVRPRLLAPGYAYGEHAVKLAPIPDGGLAAIRGDRPVVNSKPTVTNWGVSTESDPNDQYQNLNTLVTSIEIVGDRVYVGGKYNYVRNGPNGSLITQRYLAVFDRTTGAWISSIRPTLDGAVWALQATPDGNLLVAGNFTTYNGAAARGIVKINPATGARVSGFTLNLSRDGGARVIGRSLTLKDDWAYLAGRFNTATGGTPSATNAGNGGIIKFRWSDGLPQTNFKPYTDNTVEQIHASPTSDRLWIVGRFGSLSGSFAGGAGSVSLTGGNRNDPSTMADAIAITPQAMYMDGREAANAVREIDGKVYVGSTQHYFGRHDATTFERQGFASQYNGDYQAIESLFDVVYGACHCGRMSWGRNAASQQGETGRISAIGAWTTDTFDRQQFIPDLRNWSEGPWAIEPDPIRGCLWVGGDFGAGPPDVYVSGFAVHCATGTYDGSAPSVPGGVTAVPSTGSTRISWSAATDNRAVVGYEVLRDDRVVGNTSGTSLIDAFDGPGRYFVRAIDAAGNRSATSSVTTSAGVTASQPVSVIPYGSTWQVSPDGVAPPAEWANAANLATWTPGVAPLGRGGVGEVTGIGGSAITRYFARDVVVSSPATSGAYRLRYSSDDGAVVRVNGVEVSRSNMPFGPPLPTTLAFSAVTNNGGRATETYLPRDLFTPGTNRVSVELHQASATDGDAYLDLELVDMRSGSDTTAPILGGSLAASGATASALRLDWTGATASNVVGYRLRRNGVQIALLSAGTRTYLDQQLIAGTSYNYSVTAFDQSGNESSPQQTVGTTTGTPPPAGPLVLAAAGASWRYLDSGALPAASWASNGDVSAWPSGSAPLGAGALGQATTISTAAVTQYFALDVAVTNPALYRQIELSFAADDAAVVRINGTEVSRTNLPFGTPSPSTPAYAERTTAPGSSVVRVPADVLVAGVNRVSVEIHQFRAADADAFMNLTATALASNGDTQAPVLASVALSSVTRTAVGLTWPAASDNQAIGYYLIRRNGAFLVVLRSNAVSYLDQQLSPSTTYSYEVIAVDTNGNASVPVGVNATTSA